MNSIGTRGDPVKALVYGGPGKKSWQDVSEPEIIHPTDQRVSRKPR